MARLINFGTGEIVDRLTILSLKVLYGEQAGKDCTHFRNERNALLTMLNARNAFPSWYELGLELHAINAALWQAEDELRGYRQRDLVRADVAPSAVAECAFRIQTLNDQRATLIAAINAKTGDNLGAEKLPWVSA